jgi:hypothetical protein
MHVRTSTSRVVVLLPPVTRQGSGATHAGHKNRTNYSLRILVADRNGLACILRCMHAHPPMPSNYSGFCRCCYYYYCAVLLLVLFIFFLPKPAHIRRHACNACNAATCPTCAPYPATCSAAGARLTIRTPYCLRCVDYSCVCNVRVRIVPLAALQVATRFLLDFDSD